MAGETLCRLVAQNEFEVVAVRADQAHAPLQFSIPAARQCRLKCLSALRHPGRPGVCQRAGARPVDDGGWAGCGRQHLIGLFHLWRKKVHQLESGRHQLRAVLGEMPVPHLQGVEQRRVGTEPSAGCRFQQRCALSEHFVVIGAHGGNPWAPNRRQFVKVTAPLAGVTPDQGQILRGKQHRADGSEYLAGAACGRAIQAGLIRPTRNNLKIDRKLAAIIDHDGRHDRPVCTRTNQRCIIGYPVRAERGAIPKRFNEIRFAETVRANEDRPASRQLKIDLGP